MNKLSLCAFTGVALFAVASPESGETCKPFTTESRDRMTDYVRKLARVAVDVSLKLAASDSEGDAYYPRLDVAQTRIIEFRRGSST